MNSNPTQGTVIVTGASRGIGAAVAKLTAQRGYAVAVNFNAGEKEAGTVVDDIRSNGGRAIAIRADVSREGQTLDLFREAERDLGPIRALVNKESFSCGKRLKSLW